MSPSPSRSPAPKPPGAAWPGLGPLQTGNEPALDSLTDRPRQGRVGARGQLVDRRLRVEGERAGRGRSCSCGWCPTQRVTPSPRRFGTGLIWNDGPCAEAITRFVKSAALRPSSRVAGLLEPDERCSRGAEAHAGRADAGDRERRALTGRGRRTAPRRCRACRRRRRRRPRAATRRRCRWRPGRRSCRTETLEELHGRDVVDRRAGVAGILADGDQVLDPVVVEVGVLHPVVRVVPSRVRARAVDGRRPGRDRDGSAVR